MIQGRDQHPDAVPENLAVRMTKTDGGVYRWGIRQLQATVSDRVFAESQRELESQEEETHRVTSRNLRHCHCLVAKWDQDPPRDPIHGRVDHIVVASDQTPSTHD